MENIITRRATIDDLDTLLNFEQGVISSERPFDATIKDEQTHYYDLPQLLTAPNVAVMVAETGSIIVGSGYARIEDSKPYLKHQRHAYLGFMYTHPAYRGKGVNQKIIGSLKQWALSQNVTELRLEVYHHNLPAIKAYEKAGFSKLMVEMRMDIA